MNWDDVRIFVTVAREGNLAGAGRALGLDQTTIGRRLRRLQADIGGALFLATDSERRLTTLGERLLQHARSMEVSVASLLATAADDVAIPEGIVRVSTGGIFARYYLLPELESLRAEFPRIQLEYIVSDELADLERLECDIAVRMTRQVTGDYLVKRIGDIEFKAFARDAASADVDFAGLTGNLRALPEAKWLDNEAPAPFLRVNDAELLLHAVRSGAVKAYLPAIAAVASDFRPVAGAPAFKREIYLLSRPDMAASSPIQAVKSWIERCVSVRKG